MQLAHISGPSGHLPFSSISASFQSTILSKSSESTLNFPMFRSHRLRLSLVVSRYTRLRVPHRNAPSHARCVPRCLARLRAAVASRRRAPDIRAAVRGDGSVGTRHDRSVGVHFLASRHLDVGSGGKNASGGCGKQSSSERCVRLSRATQLQSTRRSAPREKSSTGGSHTGDDREYGVHHGLHQRPFLTSQSRLSGPLEEYEPTKLLSCMARAASDYLRPSPMWR